MHVLLARSLCQLNYFTHIMICIWDFDYSIPYLRISHCSTIPCGDLDSLSNNSVAKQLNSTLWPLQYPILIHILKCRLYRRHQILGVEMILSFWNWSLLPKRLPNFRTIKNLERRSRAFHVASHDVMIYDVKSTLCIEIIRMFLLFSFYEYSYKIPISSIISHQIKKK